MRVAALPLLLIAFATPSGVPASSAADEGEPPGVPEIYDPALEIPPALTLDVEPASPVDLSTLGPPDFTRDAQMFLDNPPLRLDPSRQVDADE